MNRRLKIPLQFHPFLARVPFRSLPVIRAHVHEAARLIARFAVVGSFDEGFKTEAVGFCDACLRRGKA